MKYRSVLNQLNDYMKSLIDLNTRLYRIESVIGSIKESDIDVLIKKMKERSELDYK
jgi:predicted nucleotidyltransferase